MSDKFQQKTSGILASLLIGLIIISFMFSGYMKSDFGSPSTLGKIGAYNISVEEYRNTLNQMIEQYSQMLGNRQLTSKEIESFGLKQQVIKSLQDRKLVLNLSDLLGIRPGSKEIISEIQNLPYFKENGQFSVNLYKAKLNMVKQAPKEFEESVGESIKLQNFYKTFTNAPLSKEYLKEIAHYKEQKYLATLVTLDALDLQKKVFISEKEITDYLGDANNLSKVQKLFDEKKSNFNRPEKVKIKHILLQTDGKNDEEVESKIKELAKKVNPSNFSKMANEFTQDPSGKDKGGQLPEFEKGQMAPEFENMAFTMKIGAVSSPVKTQFGWHLLYKENHQKEVLAKFDDYKNQLAKEVISDGKSEQAMQLFSELTLKIEALLKANDLKNVEKMAKQYDLKYVVDQEFNRLDGPTDSLSLTKQEQADIFSKNLLQENVFLFSKNKVATLAKVTPLQIKKEATKKTSDSIETPSQEELARQGQEFLLNRLMMEDLLAGLSKKITVKIREF